MIEFWKRWHITMTRFFMMYVNTQLWLRLRRRLRGSPTSRRIQCRSGIRRHRGAAGSGDFLLAGLWHGAGWTFICFGLVNAVGLVINQAWNIAGLPSLPKPTGSVLTMLVTIVGLVDFRRRT